MTFTTCPQRPCSSPSPATRSLLSFTYTATNTNTNTATSRLSPRNVSPRSGEASAQPPLVFHLSSPILQDCPELLNLAVEVRSECCNPGFRTPVNLLPTDTEGTPVPWNLPPPPQSSAPQPWQCSSAPLLFLG
ncbi:hypothetical protein PHLGIDRAFT_378527 [Phlebiopsis gigantea 11061_1 CR5-6]|uniref:Uncharacterized protein n=1 Tax=Phlebiopsis gigantea (strain 11061_1 CR5-6) TaxID=745531 RepID=A0A0C3SC31_PHLG1|nr:hypothetical protein PHLGIDRAFT_378527 [Phlebiopsis gigantea 11061_1 CR5-6]